MKHAALPVLFFALFAGGSLVLAAQAPPRGEIRVTPPSIPAAKRFEPLEVAFEVRPLEGTKGPIDASLILTSFGGKPRTYTAKTTDGKTFRATAIPSQPEDSSRVRISLVDEASELVFESPDRNFTVGGKTYKLSEIRRIEYRDDPRVVTESGDVLRGALSGLDSLQAEVGGQTLQIEPSKATRLLLNRIVNALPIVSYRIVAKRKDQVVAETSGRIEFKPDGAAPSPVPALRPQTIAFAPPAVYEALSAADIITAGDVDGDRRMDVVIGGGRTLGVLYGRGDGTLERYQLLLAWKGRVGNRLLVDLNGDRLPEILFFDGVERLVTLVNQGGRRFEEPRFQRVGNGNKLCAGDFNRDRYPDLAMTESGDGGGRLKVLTGKADGVFVEQAAMGVGGSADGVAARDINGDGVTDLAVGNTGGSGVGVFFGFQDLSFRAGPSFRFGGGNTPGVSLEDLNGDGKADLVGTEYWGGKLMVMLNRGDGSFHAPVPYPASPHPTQVPTADFDGDGKIDLAVPGAGRKHIALYRNRGDGTFDDPVDAATGGENARSCAIADFNRDGRPDLAVAHEREDATVSVLLNTGGK